MSNPGSRTPSAAGVVLYPGSQPHHTNTKTKNVLI